MPELPDVEGFRRELAGHLPGRRVLGVDVRDAGVLRDITAGELANRLTGHRFGDPHRHGKWLILPTDGPVLLIHSGMTGHPYYTESGGNDRDRLVLCLDRGELRYTDLRKLRGVWLAGDEDEVPAVTGPQGPDALGLGLREFRRTLHGRRGRLKPTLLDQSVVAGLGNLLIDEISWRAGIDPARPIPELAADDVRRLHDATRRTLRTAIRHGCVPGLPRWLTRVRDDPDPHCPRCHGPLRRGRVGGRATVWCPRCQPR